MTDFVFCINVHFPFLTGLNRDFHEWEQIYSHNLWIYIITCEYFINRSPHLHICFCIRTAIYRLGDRWCLPFCFSHVNTQYWISTDLLYISIDRELSIWIIYCMSVQLSLLYKMHTIYWHGYKISILSKHFIHIVLIFKSICLVLSVYCYPLILPYG